MKIYHMFLEIEDEFKIFYNNLKKINFPFHLLKNIFYMILKRWDIETRNNKIIKLPSINYNKNIEIILDINKFK